MIRPLAPLQILCTASGLQLSILGVARASTAAAYEIGHVSVHFYDASCGNRDVGVELYYRATAAGEAAPIATAPAGGFPIVAFGQAIR